MFNNYSKIILYQFLSVFTVIYIALQLFAFHLNIDNLPPELVYFWMFSLFLYVLFKEFLRWVGVLGTKSQKGELFTVLIIAAFIWMELFNVYQRWLLDKPYADLPRGYFESTIEALIILIIGKLSYYGFYYKQKYRKIAEILKMRQKAKVKPKKQA